MRPVRRLCRRSWPVDVAYRRVRRKYRAAVSSPAHTRCVTASATGALIVPRLRCGIVLRSEEDACQVLAEGKTVSVRYAPQFPAPRRERVLPGHLVAAAEAPGLSGVVVGAGTTPLCLAATRALSASGSRPTARSTSSGAARSNTTAQGLAHTCPQACPALNGGLPAEPWTGPRTPRSSWTKSGALTPSRTCGTPPSAGEQAAPRACRARISGKTAPAARLLIFVSSLVDLLRSSRDRAPGKHGFCLQGRSSPCRPSAWSGRA